MASDAVLRLSRLLLRQSDRQPIRTVNGHDLADFPKSVVRQFMRQGFLVQNQDLGDADGWVLHRDGQRIIAVEAGNSGDHRTDDPLAVETYEIDFIEICRAIRRNSGLEGPDISILGPRTVFLGVSGKGARRREFYMLRALRVPRALEALLAVRAHATPGGPITGFVPTPWDIPNDLARRLEAEKVTIVSVSELLIAGASEPFSITIPTPASTSGATETKVRLSVDTDGKVAMFDGVELTLAPREFAVLVVLANEAVDLGGFVARERISEAIRAASGKDETLEEQVDKTINRLRDAFRKDPRIAAADRGTLIETKPKVGYRLVLPATDVRVI